MKWFNKIKILRRNIVWSGFDKTKDAIFYKNMKN